LKLQVKVNVGIFKIVGCRKKNVGVQEEEAYFTMLTSLALLGLIGPNTKLLFTPILHRKQNNKLLPYFFFFPILTPTNLIELNISKYKK